MIKKKEENMTRYFDDNALSIGNTPLVKINRMAKGLKATILAKIEGRNPSYSVKCRIGANMIWDGEKKGVLKPGMEIIEPTSGNTGIALAYVAAAKGYKLHVTMPETMSLERRKVLAIFGTNIILTPGDKGMKGAVAEAERIAASDHKYFMPQQFKNPSNPEIHFKTTGPEIWEQTNGGIDLLVSGVGTGGTITGASRYIKGEKKKKIVSVAVEPVESPVITQRLAGQELKPGPHKIQGIGAGFIPDTLDLCVVDQVEQVTSEEAIEHARRLAREEGILSGVSSGAAIAAALRLGRREEFKGKIIVVILPDSGERYLSGPLFLGVFFVAGLPTI
jgi:cysteine synthase A